MFPSEIISRFIDWLYIPQIRKYIPLQTFRYAACGGLNLGLNLLLYSLTYNFILNKEIVYIDGIAVSPHIASFLLVFPVTFFTGFYLNRNVAFKHSPLRGHTQLLRYLMSVGGSILLNYFLLRFFVEILHIYPTPSQAIAALIIAVYSYLMQKFFTFKGCADI